MKHYFLFFIAVICLYQCKENDATPPQDHPKHFTLEQVKEIAAGYELADIVTEEKNAGLVYLTKEELETFLKREKYNQDLHKQQQTYLQQTGKVHSFDDYIQLLGTFPAMYADQVKQKGGEAQFQDWVNKSRQINWRIYRDQTGALSWVDPQYGDVTVEGERLDNNR
jgi:hypothetical protein